MTTYKLRGGGTCVLAHHTLEEWRDVVAARLRALGCSAAFVEAARAYYTEARP